MSKEIDVLNELLKGFSGEVVKFRKGDVGSRIEGDLRSVVDLFEGAVKSVVTEVEDKLARDIADDKDISSGHDWKKFVDDNFVGESDRVEIPEDYLTFFNRSDLFGDTMTADEIEDILNNGVSIDDEILTEFEEFDYVSPPVYRNVSDGITISKFEVYTIDKAKLGLGGGITSVKFDGGDLVITFGKGGVVVLDLGVVSLDSIEIDVETRYVYVRISN